MNLSAWLGFIFGSTIIIYLFRMLFLFLIRKFLGVQEDRKAKNLMLIASVVFITLLFWILPDGEFNPMYAISGIIIFLLGLIPSRNKEIKDVG